MPRPLSNTARRAAYAQESEEVWITLVTIDHESFTQPVRVADDPLEVLPDSGHRGVLSRGEEYIFVPFSITLPQQDESGVAKSTISIDNISREIIQHVRKASSSLNVSFEVVLASDVDTPELSAQDFRLERISYDSLTVSGDITTEFYDLEPFPSQKFTPSHFPALF